MKDVFDLSHKGHVLDRGVLERAGVGLCSVVLVEDLSSGETLFLEAVFEDGNLVLGLRMIGDERARDVELSSKGFGSAPCEVFGGSASDTGLGCLVSVRDCLKLSLFCQVFRASGNLVDASSNIDRCVNATFISGQS